MLHRAQTLVILGVLACLSTCRAGLEPNGPRYSCDTGTDCGPRYECKAQVNAERGLCFPLGACAAAETCCNGVDDDCDGAIDVAPTCSCDAGTSAEQLCDDGQDDDLDQLIDCADPDCEGQPCFTGAVCTQGACPGVG